MIDSQVSDEADADGCFHQARAHAGGILLLQAEDFDSHHMDETLEAAEDGNGHREQGDIVEDERQGGNRDEEYARRDAACPAQVIRQIDFKQRGDEVDKSSGIGSLLPFVKDEEEIENYNKEPNGGQAVHKRCGYHKSHRQNGVDFKCVVLYKLSHITKITPEASKNSILFNEKMYDFNDSLYLYRISNT